METKQRILIDKLIEHAPKATFSSFEYRTKRTGELSRFNVVLGAKYSKLLTKSKLQLELLNLEEIAEENNFPLQILQESKNELIRSLAESIVKNKIGQFNHKYTKPGLYLRLARNFYLNKNDCSLQIIGLEMSRTVLEPGETKDVISSPIVQGKKILRAKLPIGKIKEFAIDIGNLTNIKLNKQVLELE